MYTELRAFTTRQDAGRQLAVHVEACLRHAVTSAAPRRPGSVHEASVLVLGLPRGGVPVAAEVARRIHAPLHVLVARKLGAPAQPELAIGAISEAGSRVVDHDLAARCGVSDADLVAVEQRERERLATMTERFDVAHRPPLSDRTVVIVDDGIATGATARAACRAARSLGAARVVLATPAAPTGWRREFLAEADHLVCVREGDAPAVGSWYVEFGQVTDDDVRALLGVEPGTDETDGVGTSG